MHSDMLNADFPLYSMSLLQLVSSLLSTVFLSRCWYRHRIITSIGFFNVVILIHLCSSVSYFAIIKTLTGTHNFILDENVFFLSRVVIIIINRNPSSQLVCVCYDRELMLSVAVV